MDDLTMASPLHREEVLARLAAYGRDWRESKIPTTLRSAGIHTCRIAVGNDHFRLRFNQPRRAPSLVWIGRVSASDKGSQIDASWATTPWSRASDFIFLGLIGVLWGWPAIRAGVWWLPVPIIGMFLMSVLIAVTTTSESQKQRAMCATVLGQVTNAEVGTLATALGVYRAPRGVSK